MARDERDPAPNWRNEPEVGAATGGHLTPDVGATGPLFDPQTDPVPREHSTRVRPREEPDPFVVAPSERSADPAEPMEPSDPVGPTPRGREVARRRLARRRAGLRRVKRTIKHVNPFSVLKLSLFYYAFFLVVWLIFVAIVYSIVSSLGFFDAMEDLGRGLVLWKKVDISLGFVEKWAFLIGFVMYVVGCLTNLVLAFLYNVSSDVVGGIEVTFVERDV